MSAPSDIPEDRAQAMLARLAELDLMAAEHAHAKLMAAEEPSDVAELGRTYQRMARSLRQTLAIAARLKRERAQAPAEAPPEPPPIPRDPQRIFARLHELRPAAQRVIWAEHEPEEAPDWEGDDTAGYYFDILEQRLDLLKEDNSLGTRTLDEDVIALCDDLGLDGTISPRWRDLPDPPPEAFIDWDAEEDGEDTS
jgi:hypothetical protein